MGFQLIDSVCKGEKEEKVYYWWACAVLQRCCGGTFSNLHVKCIVPDSEGVHAACFTRFTEVTPDLLQAVIM